MRGGRSDGMLLRVSDLVLNIVVDVSFAGDEIRGRVFDGERPPKPFSGWLGLIWALDALIGSPLAEGVEPGARTQDPVVNATREAELPTAERPCVESSNRESEGCAGVVDR